MYSFEDLYDEKIIDGCFHPQPSEICNPKKYVIRKDNENSTEKLSKSACRPDLSVLSRVLSIFLSDFTTIQFRDSGKI